jgi:hypothetical protein
MSSDTFFHDFGPRPQRNLPFCFPFFHISYRYKYDLLASYDRPALAVRLFPRFFSTGAPWPSVGALDVRFPRLFFTGVLPICPSCLTKVRRWFSLPMIAPKIGEKECVLAHRLDEGCLYKLDSKLDNVNLDKFPMTAFDSTGWDPRYAA